METCGPATEQTRYQRAEHTQRSPKRSEAARVTSQSLSPRLGRWVSTLILLGAIEEMQAQDHDVGAKDRFDDLADGVAGQAAI